MSSRDPHALIRARGLGKRHQMGSATVHALADVDLDVATAEWVAIAGPSGSGKSTLLNLIGGIDRPSAGSITVGDRDLAQLSSDELARYRRETVGLVFQAFRLISHLSAIENVAMPLILAGSDRAPAERRAHELLGRVGLADRAAHVPSRLSAGEQQRVAVARALINGPRLLLADEPTGNLDAYASTALLDLVASLRVSDGLTVIVATHDPEVAARADRVVGLRSGRHDDVRAAH